MSKLTIGAKHMMRLIVRDRDAEGWTKVSATVFPLLEHIPPELIVAERFKTGDGRVRFTERGDGVVMAMEYL